MPSLSIRDRAIITQALAANEVHPLEIEGCRGMIQPDDPELNVGRPRALLELPPARGDRPPAPGNDKTLPQMPARKNVTGVSTLRVAATGPLGAFAGLPVQPQAGAATTHLLGKEAIFRAPHLSARHSTRRPGASGGPGGFTRAIAFSRPLIACESPEPHVQCPPSTQDRPNRAMTFDNRRGNP